MKRKLLIISLLLGTFLHVQAQNNVTLVLWHPDGTTTDVELFTKPNVFFRNDSVFVTSTVADLKFAQSDIRRFSYKGNGTGIALPQNEKNFTRENGQLVFNGVKTTDNIALYTVDGIRVPVQFTHHNGKVCLPLNVIPKGIYVLSVNGKTCKFTKK